MVSKERFTELVTVISADEALRRRLESAEPASRTEILSTLGFGDVTPADAQKYTPAFMAVTSGELSAAELETVAGGGNTTTTLTTTTTVTVSAAAAT